MTLKTGEIKERFDDSYYAGGNSDDYLIVANFNGYEGKGPILRAHAFGPDRNIDVWLNRSQVKDLMVVLGYFLHETEDEEEE